MTVEFNIPAATADIRTLKYSGVDPVNPFYIASAMDGNSAWSRSGNLIIFTVPVYWWRPRVDSADTPAQPFIYESRLTSNYVNNAEDRVVSVLSGTHSFNAGPSLPLPGYG